MKNAKLWGVTSLALSFATVASATNGANLIGAGPESCGMGGVGVAFSHGSESALLNPALISEVNGKEFSFAGTLFLPDVSYKGSPQSSEFADSSADLNLIPKVSIAHQVSDQFYWGIGMWGTAGMGVKFDEGTEAQGTMNMGTNLQLMQFAIPLAYKPTNELKLGLTGIAQYGSLDIHYNMPTPDGNTMSTGSIMSQDINFGYMLGLAYDISDELTFGAIYKSAIDMEYQGVLTTATAPFEQMGVTGITDHMETPAEYGVGVSYNFMRDHTVAFDYRTILWGEAEGFKDLNWENQDVYALGYEVNLDTVILRAGYNHGSQPIREAGVNEQGGAALNMFNLLGTPATVEDHYSLGVSYLQSKDLTINLGFSYNPESEVTFKTAQQNPQTGDMMVYDITSKHEQTCLTVGLKYNFQ